MYIVLIEWDGDIPPRTYYSRLHSLGLFVRSTDDASNKKKGLGPIKRRGSAGTVGGVIVQEGAIVCASESLAREVAALAKNEGAKVVQFGTVEVTDYQMGVDDAIQFAKIEMILGKRGRPTSEKFHWVVTCFEEMITTETDEEVRHVVTCPQCGSLNIKVRTGGVIKYRFPENGTVFERWARHRFSNGSFEVPEESKGAPVPPKFVDISFSEPKEAAVIEIMQKSADFLSQVEKLPLPIALNVLDGVLSARAYRTEETRRTARVTSCVHLFERGYPPDKVSISEQTNLIDLLDASLMLTPIGAANAVLSVGN